jgi:heptosyltransferase-2
MSFWKTMGALRSRKYDLAITPHSSLTTAYLMRLAGIPQRLGFDRWAAARHLTLRVPHLESRGLHKIRRSLHLLSVFSDREFDMQSEVFPDEAMRAKADRIIADLPRSGGRKAMICPGSLWPTKRWPEEHYSRLTTRLDEAGFNIIFDGGRGEFDLCQRIIDRAGARAANICRATTPLESAAVLGRCDLLVSNDSAPVHLGNAVRTTVFALNGPTDTMETGYFPYREGDRVFGLEMDCRPCGPHGAKRCPLGHHNCMRDLLPEAVLEAALEL